MMRTRHAFTLASGLVLLGLTTPPAWATSVSFSSFNFGEQTNSGTTSSSVSSGNNSAESLVVPTTSTIRARASSDGTANDLLTRTSHADDWTCTGGCSAVTAPLGMTATIGFDFDVTGLVRFLDLEASYTIGSDLFRFIASADSTPIEVDRADFDGVPVDVSITTDASGTHFRTLFTRPFTICPCVATDAPIISDQQAISLEMVGDGSVDAFHTFTVTLTPDDPNVVLTSADGRIAGAAPVATPVPEPATLTLTGLGFAAATRRYRRRRSRSAS